MYDNIEDVLGLPTRIAMARNSIKASVLRHRAIHEKRGNQAKGGVKVISIAGGERLDMLKAFRELSVRTEGQLRRRVVDSRSTQMEAAMERPGVIAALQEDGYVVLDDVIEDLGLVDLARTGAESLRDRGLMRKVMAVRGQGREDEILVVDSQQGRLTVGPARHEPDLTQEAVDLLGSDGCAALASLTSLLKGLPNALMKAKDRAPSPAEGSLSLFWPDL
jgi:hypothetical protein